MTTPSVAFMQKYKQITNCDTGNGIQQLDDYEKYLSNNIHDSLKFILDN